MSRYDPSVCSNVLIAQSARLREEQHRLADERRREASAFARTGDPDIGEFADAVVLFKAGEVPDNVFDVE
jgi:hypothetical protein